MLLFGVNHDEMGECTARILWLIVKVNMGTGVEHLGFNVL
jgi:hypothetical protein